VQATSSYRKTHECKLIEVTKLYSSKGISMYS
jgi:hypothetical protein